MSSIYKISPFTKVPAEQRQLAYQTMLRRSDGSPLIPWGNELHTVDSAVQLFASYNAEDSPKAAEVKILIANAKGYIRSLYPDPSEEVTNNEV